jgi:hypothetical protein
MSRPPGPRARAKQLGSTYYIGTPCPDGHGRLRRVTGGTCPECNRRRALRCHAAQKTRQWRKERVGLPEAPSERGVPQAEAPAHPRADSAHGRQP